MLTDHDEPRLTIALARGSRPSVPCALAIAGAFLVASACGEAPLAPPPTELTFSLGTNATFVHALLEHYHSALPGVRITTESSYGAYVVAGDLEEGRGDIGIAQADVVYLSYRRGSATRPTPHTSLRGIAVLGVNATYVLTRSDSDIRTIMDLKGRRVGMLEPGTSSEGIARILLEAGGLEERDVEAVSIRILPGLQQLTERTLDAVIIAAPTHDLDESLRKANVKAISLDAALIERLETLYPFLRATEVPASRLWGQSEPLKSVGADALLICRRELGDDLVYDLTRELFAALPGLVQNYPPAAAIDPSLAATTPIPLHPGAARYYRERELLK
jgi:TRAP transporter TAXI family solute receptor